MKMKMRREDQEEEEEKQKIRRKREKNICFFFPAWVEILMFYLLMRLGF
jgi:hypothetical protein